MKKKSDLENDVISMSEKIRQIETWITLVSVTLLVVSLIGLVLVIL